MQKKITKRNFYIHSFEGGVFMGGMSFLHPVVVLPALLQILGASTWMIAMTPIIMFLGYLLPGTLLAPIIVRRERLLPIVLFCGFFQRLPYLLIGGFLFWVSVELNSGTADKEVLLKWAMWLVFLCPAISGFLGGLSGPAWIEMVSRMFPPRIRASGWAIRFIVKGIIALFAGKIIAWLLENYTGLLGYSILHLICAVLIFLSFISMCFMREEKANLDSQERLGLRGYLKELSKIFSIALSDKIARRYVLVRAAGTAYLLILAFLSIYALDKTNSEITILGIFVIVQEVGAIVGNLLSAYLGNKYGGKLLILLARVLFIIAAIYLSFCDSVVGFYIIFFVIGAVTFIEQVGDLTLVVEICPEHKRPLFIASFSFFHCFALVGATFSATLLKNMQVSLPNCALIALVIIALSLILLIKIPEPRKREIVKEVINLK